MNPRSKQPRGLSFMGNAPRWSNLRDRLMDGSLLILLAALLVLAAAYG